MKSFLKSLLILPFLMNSVFAAQQVVVYSGSQDTFPQAWAKVNANFTEIYTELFGGGALPVGGTAGQLLAKIDGTDGNATWVSPGLDLTVTSPILLDTTTDPTKAAVSFDTPALYTLLKPSSVWTSRGSGAYTGQIHRMTDIGIAPGAEMRWDGTYWKVTAPTYLSFNITLASAGALNTSEQIITAHQVTLPPGILRAGRVLIIHMLWAKGGTTDIMTTARLRIGTAGTTSDNSWYTSGSAFSAPNRTLTSESCLSPTSATALVGIGSTGKTSCFSSVVANATAAPITLAGTYNIDSDSIIITPTTTMAGSTDLGQVAQMIVEIVP